MKDDCAAISALLDAYLSAELSPLEHARVDAHLESCPECAREVLAGKKVKSALSAALGEEVATDALRASILGAIDTADRVRWSRLRRLAPLAAGLLVGAALTFALTRPASEAKDTAIYSDSLLSHAACAVMRPAPRPPTRDEALARLGRYRALLEGIPVERSGELVDAHICPNRSRKFAHLVLRVDGEIVSLLVTDKSRGSLPPGDGTAHAGTVDVQTVRFPIFELAGFESRRFMGFVVTPRPELEGSLVASRLVPAAFRVLGDLDTVP